MSHIQCRFWEVGCELQSLHSYLSLGSSVNFLTAAQILHQECFLTSYIHICRQTKLQETSLANHETNMSALPSYRTVPARHRASPQVSSAARATSLHAMLQALVTSVALDGWSPYGWETLEDVDHE